MDTLERVGVACEGFRRRLARVGDGDLGRATPCAGWDVAALVDHTISTVRYVADAAGEAVHPSPSADRLGRFDVAVAELRRKVADPELAGTVVDSPFGRLALKQLASSIVVHDVLVHTWDLARATGGDERLDPALVDQVLAAMAPYDEQLRGHGFEAKVPVPEGADPQTELLCFLGRRP